MADIVMPPPEYDPEVARDREAYPNAGMLVEISVDRFAQIAENARAALSANDEALIPLGNGVMELAQEVGAQQHRFNAMLLKDRSALPAAEPAPVSAHPPEPTPVPQISKPIVLQAVSTSLSTLTELEKLKPMSFMEYANAVTDMILEELT